MRRFAVLIILSNLFWRLCYEKRYQKHTSLHTARLQNKAKEIERFLCEPINAINKLEKFHTEWKTSGPWECKR